MSFTILFDDSFPLERGHGDVDNGNAELTTCDGGLENQGWPGKEEIG